LFELAYLHFKNVNMQTTIMAQANQELLRQRKTAQSTWQRVVLLIVLAYEGAGALLGGSLLVIAPDGRLMDMPVDIMHGTFRDFLVPGILLFALGILNTAAFLAVLRKSRLDWFMSALAMGGLAIWFGVEIAILQEVHWLHAMWGLPVVLGAVVAIPLVSNRHNTPAKWNTTGGLLSHHTLEQTRQDETPGERKF
jgi:peptidoglycan/LPS O-acetylase OafA/YrhL